MSWTCTEKPKFTIICFCDTRRKFNMENTFEKVVDEMKRRDKKGSGCFKKSTKSEETSD